MPDGIIKEGIFENNIYWGATALDKEIIAQIEKYAKKKSNYNKSSDKKNLIGYSSIYKNDSNNININQISLKNIVYNNNT